MLPRENRLSASEVFAATVRRGRRSGTRTIVLHLRTVPASAAPDSPALIGLVVSKAVGGSVVRSRVKRRLRHLVRDRLSGLPAGAVLVVRALRPASTATSEQLGGDLDTVLGRLLRDGAAA